MSKYQNPFSVDYRNPVIINSQDPRVQGWKLGQTYSRMGREIEVVDEVSKPLKLDKYIEP